MTKPDWPRMMRRSVAAAYLDLTIARFDREVACGRLPMPVLIGGQERWSRVSLDRVLDAMAGDSEAEANNWRGRQPLYGAHP